MHQKRFFVIFICKLHTVVAAFYDFNGARLFFPARFFPRFFFNRIVCRRTQNSNKSAVNSISQIEYWIRIRGRTSIVCAYCVINRTEFMHRQISSHWARNSKRKIAFDVGPICKSILIYLFLINLLQLLGQLNALSASSSEPPLMIWRSNRNRKSRVLTDVNRLII